MTLRETLHHIEQRLSPLYDPREATAIAREVVCRACGYSFSQLVMHYDEQCVIDNLQSITEQLAAGRPVQYVTGVAEFCDIDFVVREGVLIPRPETAEIVEYVVAHSFEGAHILDVGTGSGAIAITLAKRVKDSVVTAVDISDSALKTAAENVERNGVNIRLVKADALTDMSAVGEFDIIVSNPPYIPQSDMAQMHKNVVDYEPHSALFVADDDALCFYRSIARNGVTMLRKGGSLFFEIYEHFGSQVAALLEQMGYSDIEVVSDMFGKQRMVWCRR